MDDDLFLKDSDGSKEADEKSNNNGDNEFEYEFARFTLFGAGAVGGHHAHFLDLGLELFLHNTNKIRCVVVWTRPWW